VVFAGKKGGFGNFIELAHSSNIHTMYGHLSRFAKGIRKGARVQQGQLIGYVGATGLATGPHLDYRVTIGGKHVNPLNHAFPDGPPVKSKFIADFKNSASRYLALLNVMTPPVANAAIIETTTCADTTIIIKENE
jgi:murein DD-endopeptidase MepM/ murein hydrolase activator NlpD